MYENVGLQVLQAKIRGFEAAGLSITKRVQVTSGLRRHRLRLSKRRLAIHTRLHLLAYCLLRGVPYLQVERCGQHNAPDPKRLLEVVVAHNVWSEHRGFYPLALDEVKLWLSGETLRWEHGMPFGIPRRQAAEWRATHEGPWSAHRRTA